MEPEAIKAFTDKIAYWETLVRNGVIPKIILTLTEDLYLTLTQFESPNIVSQMIRDGLTYLNGGNKK